MKNDIVIPEKFKKTVHLKGIDNLHNAVWVLRLYQDWRTGNTAKDLEDIGIDASLVSAAIHYILAHFGAGRSLYQCLYCNNTDMNGECTIKKGCRFSKID